MLITSLLGRVVRAVARWNRNAEALRTLHAMTDAQLRDLGIERGQIDILVKGIDPVAPKAAAKTRAPAFTLRATMSA